MTDNTYQPAKVWTWDKSAGGAFANINRPVSGPTHEKNAAGGQTSAATLFTGNAERSESNDYA